MVGARPVFGSHDFGRGRSNGEVLDDYFNWLVAKIEAIRPTAVGFESPYMPTGNNPFATPANALTVRRLYAFAGFTEAVCRRHRIKCYEAPAFEITKAFLGGPVPKRREDKKAATVKMARLLGHAVADDNEADALAIWMYLEAQFSPAMISRRRATAGLELDLHTTKTRNAPRRQPRGAQTSPSNARVNEDGFTNAQQNSAITGQLQLPG